MSNNFEPSWFQSTLPGTNSTNITIESISNVNSQVVPIDTKKLRCESKKDLNKFLELCGLRPSYTSKKYMEYLKNRNHRETDKYINLWKNVEILNRLKTKAKKESELSNNEYLDDYDYSHDEDDEEDMFCDDFVDEQYDYRYTINNYDNPDAEQEYDSSSDEDEFIDNNFSDYD